MQLFGSRNSSSVVGDDMFNMKSLGNSITTVATAEVFPGRVDMHNVFTN